MNPKLITHRPLLGQDGLLNCVSSACTLWELRAFPGRGQPDVQTQVVPEPDVQEGEKSRAQQKGIDEDIRTCGPLGCQMEIKNQACI